MLTGSSNSCDLYVFGVLPFTHSWILSVTNLLSCSVFTWMSGLTLGKRRSDDTPTLQAERLILVLEKYLYEQCRFNNGINTTVCYVLVALCRETMSTLRESAFNLEAIE